MRSTFGLVLANFRRHRLRTIATILSVAIAVGTSVVTFVALQRVYEYENGSAGVPRLMVFSAMMRRPLPMSYCTRLKTIPGIKWVGWVRGTFGKLGDDNTGDIYDFMGASTNFFESMTPVLTVPDKELQVWKNDRQGIVLTPNLMRALNKKVGDAVVLHTFLGDVSGTIDGPLLGLERQGALTGFVRYELLDQIEGNKGVVTTIVAGCDKADCPRLATDVEKYFSGGVEPVIAVPAELFMNKSFYEPLLVLPNLMAKISLLLLVVITFVTASTLAMSLRERRADFGILRSLGFRRSQIFSLVITETVLICLAGGLLGAGSLAVLFHWHGLALGDQMLSDVTVSPVYALLGAGFGILIGFLAGVWPAVDTSRIKVVEALGKA